jgi:hypothetical protein
MRSSSGACDTPNGLASKFRLARHRARSGKAGGANTVSTCMKSTYRPAQSCLRASQTNPAEAGLMFVDSPACHARPEIYGKNGLLGMFRV